MNNLLSPRFLKIIDFLGVNKTVADIGCDHGIITEYLLKNKLADFVFASDISEPSLNKARERCKNYGNISFCAGNGFEPLPQKPDAAIVAGMGGDVISEIISNEKAITKLILQPMKDSDVLYEALYKNGFFIEKVAIAREDRRFYEVISAVPGKNEKFDFSLPPKDKLIIDQSAYEFYIHKKDVLERAVFQAEKTKSSRGEERLNNMKKKLNSICEVIEECRRLMI